MEYNIVLEKVKELCLKQYNDSGKVDGVTADQISRILNMKRPNVVRAFTKLINSGELIKKEGRPVLYYFDKFEEMLKGNIKNSDKKGSTFDSLIGKEYSLKHSISLAKAAIVYPPKGLHSLIVGETGVGKSYFAKYMFKYALEVNRIKDSSRFAVFNCADYANNPQLLISHLFGVKKGAYTGASEDREGIIEKARDGILFLDEIHRLPPEGQEMLFTLIDYGYYSPLGSTKEIYISTMIICATTENTDSTLLKTFKRRIPVNIFLPPLRERTVEERMLFIKNFFIEESKRINRKINVNEEVINALLNYECINNIGQLKSDIQIVCAKAFLRSMFNNEAVEIKISDFPNEVKNGLLLSKRIKVDNFNLIFDNNTAIENESFDEDKYNLSSNIYDFIEDRTKYYKDKGLDNSEIKNNLSHEVEKYINRYLLNIISKDKEDDIKILVNNKLYDLLEKFIYLAEFKLKRKISKNTFLGLLVHLDTFLGRIKENSIIENPKIDEIRKKYPKEFRLSILFAEKLEQKFEINVPIDEIGFITMFFAADVNPQSGKVVIIVALHGNTTATSMADVANQLLNTKHAIGFDLPLSMKPEEAVVKIQQVVKEKDEGMGALLLVDMGSLKFFDKVIEDNTGIKTKAIDMVSTAVVIEATRKAIMSQSLEDIVKSVDLESRYLGKFLEEKLKKKKDVVITACSTGQGTAKKLKEFINKKYNNKEVEIINLSIKDENEFKKTVESIKEDSNILCIISAFNLNLPGIEYIPIDTFFKEFIGDKFRSEIEDEEYLHTIKSVYSEYLEIPNSEEVLDYFIETFLSMTYVYGINLDSEKLNGLLMHIGCLIQNILNHDETPKCERINIISSRQNEIFTFVENKLKLISNIINIEFSKDDIGNIVEILVNE